ncbi:hypothetical protein [Azorhizobium sp. AG788]|uniref:hypothetical protein n=1 Tax=Azorhizobium sp. AG788 TaxID=2183897 RepID=UPI0031395673
MSLIRRLSPMNSLILISDSVGKTPPNFVIGEPISASEESVAISVLMCFDGETQVTFGLASEAARDGRPDFDGHLNTPTHEVVVWTVEWEKIFVQRVAGARTRIRIWLNRRQEPDDIVITVG